MKTSGKREKVNSENPAVNTASNHLAFSHSLSLDYSCGNLEGGMCVAQAQAAAIFMCRYLSKVLRRWMSGDVYRPNEFEVYSHKSTRRRLKAYHNVIASFLNRKWLGWSLL